MPHDLNPDFQDFIDLLTSQGVDFLVVGAHALAFHGIARYTEDLDVWVRRTENNVLRLRSALNEFGIVITEEAAKGLLGERRMLFFGVEPRRIDVLNFLDGCDYDQASERAVDQELGGTPVRILSLEDYVATKRASGRVKDQSDLALLREAIGPLPGDPP